MAVNPSIFKAYDIRGIYPTDLDETAAYKIGRAFVSFLNPSQVTASHNPKAYNGFKRDEALRVIRG